MKRVVLDASVAVKWYLDEEYSAEARALLTADTSYTAPDFFYAEVANVLWKRFRRGDITREGAAMSIAALNALPIDVHDSKSLVGAALSIADDAAMAVYDALYVALASRVGLPVVTADRKLFAKAAAGRYANLLMWIGDSSPTGNRLH